MKKLFLFNVAIATICCSFAYASMNLDADNNQRGSCQNKRSLNDETLLDSVKKIKNEVIESVLIKQEEEQISQASSLTLEVVARLDSNSNIAIVPKFSDSNETEIERHVGLQQNNLPTEIWSYITLFLNVVDHKLYQTNKYFFELITDYPATGIKDIGPSSHLKLECPSKSKTFGIVVDFIRTRYIDNIPSYVWYSFVEYASNFAYIEKPDWDWSFIKYTNLKKINITQDLIGNESTNLGRFGEALRDTVVDFVNLSSNNIDNYGILRFMIALRGNNHLLGLDLSDNDFCCSAVKEFVKDLQYTRLEFIDLSYNDHLNVEELLNNLDFDKVINSVGARVELYLG